MAKRGSIPWNKGELVRRECLVCKKVFYKHPCRIRTGRGKFCSQSCNNRARLGAKHGMWKGDSVGYDAMHTWVRRHKGTPEVCEFCKRSDLKMNWANKSHKYIRDLNDWIALCVSCHKKYDYTPEYGKRRSELSKKLYKGRKIDSLGRLCKKTTQ